jgi:hypothetical protein
MRSALAITWIMIAIFLISCAFMDFTERLRGYGDAVTMLNVLDLVEFVVALGILFSSFKIIRDQSKNYIGLKISSWIFILYGACFVLFGGIDDTGIIGIVAVFFLFMVSITTLVFIKQRKKASELTHDAD